MWIKKFEQQLKAADENFGRMVSAAKNKFNEAFIFGHEFEERFQASLSQGWRIEKLLPEFSALLFLYGASGSYKTFLALCMALSIAAGNEWHGKKVKQCPVVFVAAEGQSGILKRIKAWMVLHEIQNLEHFTLLIIPCLLDDPLEVAALVEALKSLQEPPGIIFIDTLARSMVGDENSTRDMGSLVAGCGLITQETEAQVVLIHHSGKDTSRGPRGASALNAAADTILKCEKQAERIASLTCEKQKDGEPFPELIFNMEIVSTGHFTADDNPISSLVPVYDPAAVSTPKRHQIKGANKIALDALHEAINEHREKPSEEIRAHQDGHIPQMVVLENHWRQAAYSGGISAGAEGAKRKAFSRARSTLMELGIVKCRNDYYWVGQGDRTGQNGTLSTGVPPD